MREIIDRLISINDDYVLICKCNVGSDIGEGKRGILKEGGGVLLELSKHYSQTTNFVEVVDVGQNCRYFKAEHALWRNDERYGVTTLCSEMGDGMHWIQGPYWIVRERMLAPVTFSDAGITALGDWVVVEKPTDKQGLIVTPDIIDDQHNVLQCVSVGSDMRWIEKGNWLVVPSAILAFEFMGKRYGALSAEDVYAAMDEDGA